MRGPEAKVKDAIKTYLKEIGAYQFWPVQTGYGAATSSTPPRPRP